MSFSDVIQTHWDKNVLFSALLELTYRCNLDCVICYNDRELPGRPLTFAQYDQLLTDLAAMGVVYLTLSGGEPLAHPDFFRIGARARDLGFVIRVKSNGHALRDSLLRRLVSEVDPYAVEMSLHGADAATHDRQTRVPGSFERLMDTIAAAHALGLRITLNTPVTRWNADQLDAILDLAEAKQVRLQIDPDITPRDDGHPGPTELGLDADGLKRVLACLKRRADRNAGDGAEVEGEATAANDRPPQVVSKKHCGAGSSTIAVDPYGNVYPCVQYRQAVGNLHRQRAPAIWAESRVLQRVREEIVAVKQWRETLGEAGKAIAFCPGTARLQTGSAVALYPFAALRKALGERTLVDSH